MNKFLITGLLLGIILFPQNSKAENTVCTESRSGIVVFSLLRQYEYGNQLCFSSLKTGLEKGTFDRKDKIIKLVIDAEPVKNMPRFFTYNAHGKLLNFKTNGSYSQDPQRFKYSGRYTLKPIIPPNPPVVIGSPTK